MKIIYLPLDERPCNAVYPELMTQPLGTVTLITPPLALLGKKKTPADPEALFTFIEQNIEGADALVVSLEMLIYGGLLPSRLHHTSETVLQSRLERFLALMMRHPQVKIYAFQLIMRTPRYNSDDEEPEYYADYGADIFRRAWLRDKEQRERLSDEEQCERIALEQRIPESIIQDYELRRKKNIEQLIATLNYVKQGKIHYLAIPQDDSAEYGYTAQDQRRIGHLIDELGLFGQVQLYPGADEAGAALIARAVNDSYGKRTAIYVFFSSTLGPQITPLYEDRPMLESVMAHINVVGGDLVDTPEKADLILAINSPGKFMQESWDQFARRDITYSSYRYLPGFVGRIRRYLDADIPVVIADAAYANGGDYQLITLLDRQHCLDQVISYKGWNTFCNTLGSTLAQGVLALNGADKSLIRRNVLLNLLDDVCYQAKVRRDVTENTLPHIGASYFSLGENSEKVMQEVAVRLNDEINHLLVHSFRDLAFKYSLNSPWNRMFEIEIKVELL